jgi:4'-phosphopantetheinyl transferase
MFQIICTDISTIDVSMYERLYASASSSRQYRADRCRLFADKVRCVAGDALLRYALACRGHSGGFRVDTGPHGKPFLPDVPDFHYSLSHSGRWAAIAWGNTPVGLDIETIAPRPHAEAIVRRRCTPAELSYLLDAPEPERLQRFYRLWTAKEAYVKYLGTGLTRPLSSFSVIPPESLGIPLHWDLLPDACLCLCGGEVCRMAILPAAELPEREVYPAR